MDIIIHDDTKHLTQEKLDWMEELLQFSADKLTVPKNAEISITIVDNQEIRKINKEYRNKDTATDVISFALEDDEDIFMTLELEDDEIPRDLGDIFISYDKAVEQAGDYGHSVDRELGFLLVHGFLHLNGYDHMTEADEKEMFSLQEEILSEYGLKR
ncbi:rRNA maturation RNase YbeY [Alkalibacterium sp. 20]|uniref:rRNA maturation RNase YbeY n=1 Tax=Alkalibacterium sp. 20 TaxID=1798803 RepID=UPI0009004777|nr:rRNA maturation RNase YbeY [Alkalibacterium sp. 20]OJF90950.1 rRNA maturation RNase YbeY [Alkalibacterium sp. 20]